MVNSTDQTPCQHGIQSSWEAQNQVDFNRDGGLRMKTLSKRRVE